MSGCAKTKQTPAHVRAKATLQRLLLSCIRPVINFSGSKKRARAGRSGQSGQTNAIGQFPLIADLAHISAAGTFLECVAKDLAINLFECQDGSLQLQTLMLESEMKVLQGCVAGRCDTGGHSQCISHDRDFGDLRHPGWTLQREGGCAQQVF
jgi:hypothetical protein